ncbi:hypothetical protein THS27_14880 [Thalassospira sp. MCCC 1A01428]|nr:hypothetical protein THS27_14880 [Thalassospira sp. MCCC 1A01428]
MEENSTAKFIALVPKIKFWLRKQVPNQYRHAMLSANDMTHGVQSCDLACMTLFELFLTV